MWTDPIVEEIQKFREEYAASFNNDMNAIYKDIKRREEESKKAGWKFITIEEMRARNAEKTNIE